MWAYYNRAAVLSGGPTSAQFTAASFPQRAMTFPDVSDSRHAVAVIGAGGSNSGDSHES